MWSKIFTFLFGLKICTNVKIKYKKGVFAQFLKRKKSLNLQKIENDVATFPYWLWFGNNVLSV